MYGRPDYFLRVAVADHAAYEAFSTGKLSGLPAVLRYRLTSALSIERGAVTSSIITIARWSG